jgi:hypothetical protein
MFANVILIPVSIGIGSDSDSGSDFAGGLLPVVFFQRALLILQQWGSSYEESN